MHDICGADASDRSSRLQLSSADSSGLSSCRLRQSFSGAVKKLVDYEIRVLCSWKKVDVMGWTVQTDPVHLVASIPPKLSVSQFMGSLKGKLAIKLFKRYPKLRQKPYRGNHFWARGFFVNTSGLIEEMIRRYFRYQEDREREEERNRNNFDLSS